jgi:type II secretory pathway pseudopilin PulG
MNNSPRRLLFRKGSSSSGFTLIEILIFLVISSLLTLFALALFQRSMRRSTLQSEAIEIAMRLEQAKTLSQSKNNQFRINFSESEGNYTPEVYNSSSKLWVAAEMISGRPVALKNGIRYGFPQQSDIPDYGPSSKKVISALPPSPSSVQFNSRGFPVVPTDVPGDPQPFPTRTDNEIYLTDGKDFFAVTVDILGLVRIWGYNGDRWVLISK